MYLTKLFSEGFWRDDIVAITRSPEIWLYGLLVFFTISITFVSLRALGSIVPGAGVVMCVLFFWQYRKIPRPSLNLVGMWAAFMALLVYGASIAPDADYAWGRVNKLAMFSFSALLIWTCAQQGDALRPLKTIMVGNMIICIVFGLIEGLTGGFFFWISHDVAFAEAALAANRPMNVLTLMVWPVVLVLAHREGPLPVVAILLGLLLASLSTESQSSQLGVLTGSVVLALALVRPRITGWLCITGGVVAILGMPFFFASVELAEFIGQSQVARTTILPRLELWTFVGEKVIAQFPFGYGLEAGRTLSLDDMEQLYFAGELMHHPHNGVLQIWLEFGLIGAMSAAFVWSALLYQSFQMDRWQAAAFLACTSCFLIIGSVSHGLWQSWWVSALALVPYLFAIARVPDKS